MLEILRWDLLEGDLAEEPAEISWACPFPQRWAPESLCLLVSDHALFLGFTTKGQRGVRPEHVSHHMVDSIFLTFEFYYPLFPFVQEIECPLLLLVPAGSR